MKIHIKETDILLIAHRRNGKVETAPSNRFVRFS